MKKIKVNTNDYVWVKLKPEGEKIVKQEERFWSGLTEKKITSRTTHGDWTRFQLWELIQIFGSSIVFGMDPPFETNIMIESEAETTLEFTTVDSLKQEQKLPTRERTLVWGVAVVALASLETELIVSARIRNPESFIEDNDTDVKETRRVLEAVKACRPVETSHKWVLQRLAWAQQTAHISHDEWEAVINVKEVK